MKLLSLPLLVMLSALAQAQNNPTKIYLDKSWKPISDPAEASYYRTVEPQDGKFMVHDYYINGQLQMEALCTAYQPKLKWEGVTKLYQ